MPNFTRTLEIIRDNPDSFYTGELANDIVKDIQDGGGIITLEDLKNYRTKVRTPLSETMGNYTWYTNPPPGSGAVLSMILNIVKGKISCLCPCCKCNCFSLLGVIKQIDRFSCYTGYNFTEASRKDLNSSVLTYH